MKKIKEWSKVNSQNDNDGIFLWSKAKAKYIIEKFSAVKKLGLK